MCEAEEIRGKAEGGEAAAAAHRDRLFQIPPPMGANPKQAESRARAGLTSLPKQHATRHPGRRLDAGL